MDNGEEGRKKSAASTRTVRIRTRVVRFTRAHEGEVAPSLGERDGGDWLFWLEIIEAS
jgi:hypothetical protein